jgi:hypothetical protein
MPKSNFYDIRYYYFFDASFFLSGDFSYIFDDALDYFINLESLMLGVSSIGCSYIFSS